MLDSKTTTARHAEQRSARAWRGSALAVAIEAASALAGTPARADGGPGSVPGWGYDNSGQVGDGSTSTELDPFAVSAAAIPPGTTITQVAVGYSHSVALSAGGQAYAWGDDSSGQFGNGTTTSLPVPVAVTMPASTTFARVAAGASHNLALSAAGRLYAWGANTNGQLGAGTTTDSLIPATVAAGAIPPGATITEIAARDTIAIAVKTHAPGRLRASATYVRATRRTGGHGYTRHTSTVHHTVTYATAAVSVAASGKASVTLTPAKAARSAASASRHGLAVKVELSFTASGAKVAAARSLTVTVKSRQR